MNRIAATETSPTTPVDAADRAATGRPDEAGPAAACSCAGLSRRRVVTTGALGALAATALAACGGDDDGATTTPTAGETAGGGATGGSGGAGAGGVVAKVADVPVGGAIPGQTPDGTKIILSQPEAGKVVAFDSRCPHQGCQVAPQGDVLACPCHGSKFQVADGAVINGPATKGLTPVTVTISGADIVAG
jgi:cytochrome b6-f complex iron-sulfur subunit